MNENIKEIIVKGLVDLWQGDLVEMQLYARFSKSNRYILVVINAFTKYVWTEPV